MALAEARAAWQRTANRCFVQEDAKRAPKLAYCSPVPPSVKQADKEPTSCADESQQHIPNTAFNLSSPYPNLSPNSKWWLQQQSNCSYQKDLMNEQFKSIDNIEGSIEVKLDVEEMEVEGFEVSKNGNEVYFNAESSWIGSERNSPWWRTADTDELASFVAQRSLGYIENCDLPRPQNARIKKNDGTSSQKLMSAEGQLVSDTDKRLRDVKTHERTPEMNPSENDMSMAQLMEALRRSQTRAREAETAAKQACAQKDHIVKLVLRQASQLFAHKQWLRLLQLENMYLQLANNKNETVTVVFPIMLPRTPQKSRKRARQRSCPQYDVSRNTVLFALGLGLVGAGFLLGCTIGWMLPTW